MSDEKLRELERRWKETGSVEDEAAYLVELVRVGAALDWSCYSRLSELNLEAAVKYLRGRVAQKQLTKERLELAAYCGDTAAQVAIGKPPHSAAEATPASWVAGLIGHGQEAAVVVAMSLALARARGLAGATPQPASQALATVEKWLAGVPDPRATLAAAVEAQSFATGSVAGEDEASVAWAAGLAARLAADIAWERKAEHLLPMGLKSESAMKSALEVAAQVIITGVDHVPGASSNRRR